VSSGGTDWDNEDEGSPPPFGPKPFGPKPFGPKPFGPKPFGPKPFGPKPFGPKPFGPKDVGDTEGLYSSADDWGAVLAELVCERSAVIRMGATLVAGPELRVPTFAPNAEFRPPGQAGPDPGGTQELQNPLRPGDWMLEAAIGVPIRILDAAFERVEIAESFLLDLAEVLAVAVDKMCLGTGAGGPQGIDPRRPATGGALLANLRDMVQATRSARPARNPGWILHPDALDTVARFVTQDGLGGNPAGRTVDSSRLLELDGADGGTLLGFPFLTSAAATEGGDARAYFSVDWQEAWLGVEPYLVSLYATGEPLDDPPGSTVLRASMPLDFTLRREDAFAWTVV
jgi:hypothetical protein